MAEEPSMPPAGPAPPTPPDVRRTRRPDEPPPTPCRPPRRRPPDRRRRRPRRRPTPPNASVTRGRPRPTPSPPTTDATSARCSRSCARAAVRRRGPTTAGSRGRGRRRADRPASITASPAADDAPAVSARPTSPRTRPRPTSRTTTDARPPRHRARRRASPTTTDDLARPRRSGRSRTSRTTCSTACAASGARSTSPRCCRRARGPARPLGARPPAGRRPAYAAGAPPPCDAESGGRPGAAAAPRARCSPSSRPRWSRRSASGSTSSLESIDARTPADAEIAIAQRLGARYREWRGEQLEERARRRAGGGLLPGASYDAAPDGARLRWVPAVVGQVPRLRRQRARTDGEGRATSRPGSRTRRRTRAVAACSSSTPPDAAPATARPCREHRSL